MDIVLAMNLKVKHALDERDVKIEKLENIIEFLVKTGDCPDICPYREKKRCPGNKESDFDVEACWNIVWHKIKEIWHL